MNHPNQQPQPAQASSKAVLEDQDQTAGRPMGGTDDTEESKPVTASLATGDSRIDFLPFYFGTRRMLRGEALVYGWMDRLCKTYNGGYWSLHVEQWRLLHGP